MSANGNFVIQLKNVSKYYPQGVNVVKALEDVNLQINQGEFWVITGASGSGKTTLLHVIGMITKPTRGELYLANQVASQMEDDSRTQMLAKIGKIFQRFYLLPDYTAQENVALALVTKNVKKKERDALTKKVLSEVGLAERANHKPSQLSGGEQQRVAIARAIVIDPIMIIADEPTGNLDHDIGEEIINILFALNRRGNTILLVTHNQEIADRIPNKIVMKDGKIESITRG